MIIFSASGGGTKGCFHGGVLEALLDHYITMDGFVGVSTGALIAGWMCQSIPGNVASQTKHLNDYKDIWMSLKKQSDIRDGNWLTAAWRAVTKKPSLFSLEPLRQRTDSEMDKNAKILSPVRLGVVDLQSTSFVAFEPKNRDQLINGMIASSTIPLIAPPVVMHYDDTYIVGVDGGVRTVSPLETAVELAKTLTTSNDPITIVVSNATPVAGYVPSGPYKTLDTHWPVWKIAMRALWIEGQEVAKDDLRKTIEINDLIRFYRESGCALPDSLKDKREVKILVANPDYDPYNTLDVIPKKIEEFWKHGFQKGEEIAKAISNG